MASSPRKKATKRTPTPVGSPSKRSEPTRKPSPRGVVVFDLDGTLLDDMKQIGRVAAKVLHDTFGTPLAEAELQYYATTGMPFELQIRQLYPEATEFERLSAARTFHEEKIKNAYSHVSFFPEVPKLLK